MKRFAWLVPVLIAVFSISVSAEELFRDLPLAHGFSLSATTSQSQPLSLGPVLQQGDGQEPSWRLAQWGTRFNIAGASVEEGRGLRILENEAKRVVIHSGGLSGAGVTLTVLGGVEYGRKLREEGEPWPHLLIEQRFPAGLSLSDYTALDFSLEFRLGYCVLATARTVDIRLHTGHINTFFTVHNRNSESADFNDMIWFGLPLFDARYELPVGHQAVDGGKDDASGKFICTLPGDRFYEHPTGDGTWHTLRGDLVVLIGEALAASQARGFLVKSTVEDLQITSFNVGWEVPGPYDCEITLKGLQLQGTAKR